MTDAQRDVGENCFRYFADASGYCCSNRRNDAVSTSVRPPSLIRRKLPFAACRRSVDTESPLIAAALERVIVKLDPQVLEGGLFVVVDVVNILSLPSA